MEHKVMLSYEELPVLVVSAADRAAADAFITELIDDEADDVINMGEGPRDRVWRIRNKYYTAEVRVHPLADGEPLIVDVQCVEAHVVRLAAGEGEAEARARWGRLGAGAGAGAHLGVGVAAGAWDRPPPGLERWAASQRVEIVSLAERAPSPPPSHQEEESSEPFPETYGVERVRGALHAHRWRSARMRHQPHSHPQPQPQLTEAGSSSEGELGEGEEGDDEEAFAVERAEAFARALGALGGMRESVAGAGVGGAGAGAGGAGAGGAGAGAGDAAGDALRRQRAEDVVAAFARALGLDLQDC